MEVIVYILVFIGGGAVGIIYGMYRGIRIGYEFANPHQSIDDALDNLMGQLEENNEPDTLNINATKLNEIWYFHDEEDNFILQNNDYKMGVNQLREKYPRMNLAVYVLEK